MSHLIPSSLAFETAEKLSKNLEKEVVIKTMEAVQAKNEALASEKNISNLLNNMRQSVFSVGADGNIIPPVSEYSHEIFGSDIKSKTIYDTLLKDFDKELEKHSDIENKILFPRALELQDKISDEIRNISFLN